ncbi:hypothetical protein A2U01_0099589, partial [Trifolium medium]|nr:hypothetical protein [Trifolium medium]
ELKERDFLCYQCKGDVEKVRHLHRKSIEEDKGTATNRDKAMATTVNGERRKE